MINTKQDLITALLNNRQLISRFGIKRVGIFGSFVRGDSTPSSDVDVLVDFYNGQKTYRNLLGFAELAESFLGRRVDVLTPQSLSPFIAPYIQQEIEYVQIN